MIPPISVSSRKISGNVIALFLCLSGFSFIGCSKSSLPEPDPKNVAIVYITGSEGLYTGWRLTDLIVNQVAQSTVSTNGNYQVTYSLNGSFIDTDGIKGEWTMVNKDSLQQTMKNINGVPVIQGYRVMMISANQMMLSYKANGKNVITSFVSVK